jgi:hypothetical protein
MFVDIVQQGRIAKGQCPALRPVFLKPHGVAHGTFKVRKNIPSKLKVGLFAGTEYPLWARFSSDTQPTSTDFKSTVGIGLKLFDAPTPKIYGLPEDQTFDFILQNMDVFFVDTAKDMCEFTKAGVIDGDYGPYLKKHPKTAKILNEMAKPVASCLATPYWSGLPFSLGPKQAVKYKLEPTIKNKPPASSPVDPSYLEADLVERLGRDGAKFKFMVQLRTEPKSMPLDKATVPWSEEKSPFVHVADVVFPKQDIRARGQAEYGENLSYNIWRVTEDHRPLGSIADARRVVYAASAEKRRNVNGVPDGEPAQSRPELSEEPCVDDVIVRAAIHPGIGIARVGNAKKDFYIGPEVTEPAPRDSQFYRDKNDALKREAARFRIYGYNAAGEVVRELTADNAKIEWTAHIANRKADWFRFITAMDIPQTKDLSLIRRNAEIKGEARAKLVIDPGSRSISGASQSGKKAYSFDTGKFKKEVVYLGELQTDEAGRLLVLSGRGRSESPGGKPPFDPKDPDSFNNANDWFDDVADGPVDATVSIKGHVIPVEGAWVVAAPPNYAPDIIGWRTLYDLLIDVYVGCGWLPVPTETSFTRDVLPQLRRLSNLQWVNKGFYTIFGKGSPMDFEDENFIAKLNQRPTHAGDSDPYQEMRRQLLNAFRTHDTPVNEPRIWPWIYGDDFGGSLFGSSTDTMLALPAIQQLQLQRWADGDFIDDWNPNAKQPGALSDVPLQQQPTMLDKAALHFCLADAFHPGCEVTWPMRHATLYSAPFRIRRRQADKPEIDYGPNLDQATVLSPRGPLHAQGPGDITRWMGLPWQGDTAYCRSGYDADFDLYLPTFWPARVPNNVLTWDDYEIVIDQKRSREERIAAYARRASWYRFIDQAPDIPKRMERMIAHFGAQGVVEAMPGVKNDPVFPETMYVESLPATTHKALKAVMALVSVPTDREAARLQDSVWGDAEHLRAAQALRARRRVDD